MLSTDWPNHIIIIISYFAEDIASAENFYDNDITLIKSVAFWWRRVHDIAFLVRAMDGAEQSEAAKTWRQRVTFSKYRIEMGSINVDISILLEAPVKHMFSTRPNYGIN